MAGSGPDQPANRFHLWNDFRPSLNEFRPEYQQGLVVFRRVIGPLTVKQQVVYAE